MTTAIADHVEAKISGAVTDASTDGVMRGKFLTPNLQETSRWCNLDAVLAGLGLGGLTGIALAARVAERIPIDATNPPIVITWSSSATC